MLSAIKLVFIKFFKTLIGLTILLISSACSPVKVLNAIVTDDTYQLTSDVNYGSLPRQKLDIYTPSVLSKKAHTHSSATSTPQQVVIFFYGGNWDSGEKEDYKFVAEALASQGYIVVIPNYRIYPDVLFPELMHDPALVAKWAKSNINQYGGDANTIFLSGHSAGAHLAVMLAVNPEYLAKVALKPSDFVGVIGLAGPYDFLPLKSERLKTIFGDAAQQLKSQPINFVDGKNPPMLLAIGLKDGTVWPRNSYNLANKIKDNKGLAKVVEFKDYGHVDMVAKLAKPLRGDGALLKSIVDFIDDTTFNRGKVKQF